MGIGICLIILMQEKDSFSFKFALVPLIFNNLLMICSQCMMSGPIYVNNRMVIFGALWYIASIIAFFAAYHKLIDFFYIFDDLFMFSTGLSLFYSWQTYEKNDITFGMLLSEHANLYSTIRDRLAKVKEDGNDEEKIRQHMQ